jgi:phosphoadenosine phosphosulfate reductase
MSCLALVPTADQHVVDEAELLRADPKALQAANCRLAGRSAEQRVEWALENLPGAHVLSSSFGAQSAVALHLLVTQKPELPIILIDTGYLFTETYAFIDQLRERLDLNLQIYRSNLSPAWQESRYGKLWEHGIEGIDRYNTINKVEPMQRALLELNAGTWFAGLRRSQSNSRRRIEHVELRDGRFKLHPIADWTDRDIGRYLSQHHLPYHPLWDAGYISIGDTHTTRAWKAGMTEEDTRFFGLKRECGLHGLAD